MNSLLLEPQCVPALPDFMLLDEEDSASADAWPTLGLACFSPVGCSAPVPISAPSSRRTSSGELVDSLESSQTLLGASLGEASAAEALASASAAPQQAMRFVPVPMSPAAPQPYLYQQQPRYAAPQYGSLGSPNESSELLYCGYGAVAAPQPAYQHSTQSVPAQHAERGWGSAPAPEAMQYQYTTQQAQHAQQQQWELPPTALPIHVPNRAAEHHAGSGGVTGISSLDLQYGFATQFGQPLPIPSAVRAADDRMRRALSEEALQIGNYRGFGAAGLATVAEGDNSEGSDNDTLGEHHQPARHARRGLPVSQSAPTAGMMTLERSASSRRPLGHHALAARAGASAASPRTICLKLKGARPRPPAAARAAAGAAAAAAAAAEASPRPARFAARRSVALSAAAMADDDYTTSDSDAEVLPSGEDGEASEEGRSGGGSSGAAGAANAGSAGANGKKKHNPWSLTETEALVEGVRLLGPSKWAEIKKLAVGGIAELLHNRSAVDLKDKWRNLTRVARLPKSVLKARAHKSTSDIPLELLLTVKDLMEMSRD